MLFTKYEFNDSSNGFFDSSFRNKIVLSKIGSKRF